MIIEKVEYVMANTATIDVSEANKRFIELLSWVRTGQEVILTEHQKPVARVVPMTLDSKTRVAGLHAGQIQMREDFDEPLPDEFWNGAA